jgi:hypothetical protein
MNRKLLLTTLIFCASLAYSFAQENTVGLLSYNFDKSYEGYNLIYPHRQPDIFLLDNCGELVHLWEGPEMTVPGNTAYLMPNGNLICTRRNNITTADPIFAGGGGATVEIRSWDNDLLWEYTKNDAEGRLHHDIAIKGNGNILMIQWDLMTREEAIQAGRDTALLAQNQVWPEKIIEVNMDKEIVWEWNARDHLIQDFDSTKDNFGVISENPGKINFNYDTNDGKADWLHANSIDYHEERGQILLSVPQFDEVWIIDNTTTTEEAAGTFGGRSNRGGELIYRWGNDFAYGADTLGSNQFHYQHDAQWVDDFVSPSHPDFDRIAVFNNRIGDDFSAVTFIDPGWDMYKGTYAKNLDDTFAPEVPYREFTHPDPQAMYSTGLSGVQALANGNYLVNSGRQGYAFELTPDNEIVWEYITPINNGVSATQGDSLALNANLTFRMTRLPVDFPAFEGRDLSPIGFIELAPNEDYCDRLVPVANVTRYPYNLSIAPNPTSGWMTIEFDYAAEVDFEVFDIMGRPLRQFKGMGARKFVDLGDLQAGIYFLQINGGETQRFVIEK